uniref:TSG101 and ALIX binding domain-containing protein n=1 Tax=Sphaeramia orbicularis TaxID=375764 RepID=A0A673BB88_9TELE
IELQKKLDDALEKNKQWLDYDQQREAYVRAILARMLWLEKQLKEANWACSQQHNANHSDGELQGQWAVGKDYWEYDMIRWVTNKLVCRCKEKQNKVEEVEQQLQIELNSRKPDQFSDNEEQWLKGEAKDLQGRLNKEKRRSAALELQVCTVHHNRRFVDVMPMGSHEIKSNSPSQTSLLQRFMVNHHEKTQENIGVLERTPWRNILPPSPHSNLLDDSVLECPGCRSVYPASQYKDLLDHIDWCLD